MNHGKFNRRRIKFHPLSERRNKVRIERDMLTSAAPVEVGPETARRVAEVAERIRHAKSIAAPVVMAFGAHTIKNGLGPLLGELVQAGWIDHLATNGAGVIHDWEFAFQGESSEDVRGNVAEGKFGIWQETGFHINLAILLGAFDGCGYGESVGRLISAGCHDLPPEDRLLGVIAAAGASPEAAEKAAAAADLKAAMQRFDLAPGKLVVEHPFAHLSIQAIAYEAGVPFTSHPMFGHDIIYTHPLSCGAAVGRTAERDFLSFANAVAQLEGGVYLSVGSAVMSPMIFEKSLSMARNVAHQDGARIDDHFMAVVDLAESTWDWTKGEPPTDSPDYYLRHCKTFHRMGGTMRYIRADNRDFLLCLARELLADAP